jgi:hypothetical protein
MIIIDKSKRKAIKCCHAEAARIIGVSEMTIYRWSKKGFVSKPKYECYFDVEIRKIEGRGIHLKGFKKN